MMAWLGQGKGLSRGLQRPSQAITEVLKFMPSLFPLILSLYLESVKE